jgi:hypothetical protein
MSGSPVGETLRLLVCPWCNVNVYHRPWLQLIIMVTTMMTDSATPSCLRSCAPCTDCAARAAPVVGGLCAWSLAQELCLESNNIKLDHDYGCRDYTRHPRFTQCWLRTQGPDPQMSRPVSPVQTRSFETRMMTVWKVALLTPATLPPVK